MRILILIGLVASALAACGDDGGNRPDPRVIAGGGIGDGAIDGVVNLYVIDDDTRMPIAGATVKVGDVSGTTDDSGLFVAGGLIGPQTVVAKASGYRSEMWVGANGANMTMNFERPIDPIPETADLGGSIPGFSSIPVPPGHARLGVVTYLQTDDLGNPENEIKTVPKDANLCVTFAADTTSACSFAVTSRTGTVALLALIFDRDLKGTPGDFTDDTQELVRFAYRGGITVVAGVNQTGQDLALLAVADIATETIDFGMPPSNLTTTFGIIGVETADGIFQIPAVTAQAPSLKVPKLAAVGATGYRLSGIATTTPTPTGCGDEPPAIPCEPRQQSIVLRRAQTGATISAGTWMTPPSNISISRTTASWTASSGATLHSVEFLAGEMRLMNVSVFDASTTFDIPDVVALPSGTVQATVGAIGADGLDVTDFELDRDKTKLNAIASTPAQVAN